MAFLYAAVTVLAWGTWLFPSQKVRFSAQEVRVFYVAAANLLIAGAVAATQGLNQLTAGQFWLPFSGGIIWALGGWAAFTATARIGLVRAFGVWAPLNIFVSVLFGAVVFHEFVALNARTTFLLCAALLLITTGVLMIIFSKGDGDGGKIDRRASVIGFGCAIAAGVLWAAYYLPIKVSNATMWVAAFPLACGMFAGCLTIVLVSRKSLSLPSGGAYARAACSGILWACGNYGMLLLVGALGAGKGFTISQLAVVVNAICGIYLLKDPEPNSRPARLALGGCVIATAGAIMLGRLR